MIAWKMYDGGPDKLIRKPLSPQGKAAPKPKLAASTSSTMSCQHLERYVMYSCFSYSMCKFFAASKSRNHLDVPDWFCAENMNYEFIIPL